MKENGKCVICNGKYDGYGHNAEPVKKGRCCGDCNSTKVIPARIKEMGEVVVDGAI